jgi:hypothetical protein
MRTYACFVWGLDETNGELFFGAHMHGFVCRCSDQNRNVKSLKECTRERIHEC